MLDVFAPNTDQAPPSELAPVDALIRLTQALEMLLQLENAEFRSSAAYGVLVGELRKLKKLNFRFGPTGAQRSIETCITIDKQLKILGAQNVRVRKESLREIKRWCFNLWQIAATSELAKLKEFGAALTEQLNTLSNGDAPPDTNWSGYWSDDDSLHHILTVVASVNEGWASARGIELRVKTERLSNIRYSIDADGIAIAFEQLLQNAIKYTGRLSDLSDHDATWVTCEGWLEHEEVCISVESWGLALTPEEMDADLLCGYGYRGYFAKVSDIEGTGRGLAQVRSIMDRNDGRIEISSSPVVKGKEVHRPIKTTFTLKFPMDP